MDEDRQLYFIEMNTRIQVEHPVTEAITGVDLVKAQLRIAAGERLDATSCPRSSKFAATPSSAASTPSIRRSSRRQPARSPHSMCRAATACAWIRRNTAEGVVPPYYDSLIAKLIVHGVDRAEAIARMERALSQFIVQGIDTSISLHQAILRIQDFRAGEFDTKFMERFLAKSQE